MMISDKLRKIKLLILDVDGVLTDGRIILTNHGDEVKSFNVKDGLGIKLLQKIGIEVAIITGKQSELVHKRFTALGVSHIYQNQPNKISAYQDLLSKLEMSEDQVAYIGDDLPDLSLMNKVGVSVTVNDGHYLVKDQANICLSMNGGHGAVREFADMIYQACQFTEQLVFDYIKTGESGTYVI